MNSKASSILLVLAGVSLLIVTSSIFTVNERQKAILFRFGEIVRTDYDPGLHFKLPFVNNVQLFDSRVQTLDSPAATYLTLEQKYVVVDSYVKWRIRNIKEYFVTTGGNIDVANSRLAPILQDGLRAEFGKREVIEVISGERSEIMEIISEDINEKAARFGIEVLSARIKRVDLPDQVSESVFQRMESERNQKATELRSEGREESEKIRAEADRRRSVILSEALQESEQIRGEGDAIATNLYSETYRQDEDFYRFYRSMNAYQSAFSDPNDLILLDANSKFFDFFDQQ